MYFGEDLVHFRYHVGVNFITFSFILEHYRDRTTMQRRIKYASTHDSFGPKGPFFNTLLDSFGGPCVCWGSVGWFVFGGGTWKPITYKNKTYKTMNHVYVDGVIFVVRVCHLLFYMFLPALGSARI